MDNNTLTRRAIIEQQTPAELAIGNALMEVENCGADERLTNAVIKLMEARNLVADYVDNNNSPSRKLNFGQAIEAMKQGKKVARTGWNGKGMYLWLLPENSIPKEWIKDPILLEIIEDRDKLPMLGCIRMKTATGEVLTGWLASQSDMLSEDWIVIE